VLFSVIEFCFAIGKAFGYEQECKEKARSPNEAPGQKNKTFGTHDGRIFSRLKYAAAKNI
jgi:hypothetical protein